MKTKPIGTLEEAKRAFESEQIKTPEEFIPWMLERNAAAMLGGGHVQAACLVAAFVGSDGTMRGASAVGGGDPALLREFASKLRSLADAIDAGEHDVPTNTAPGGEA